MAKKNNQKFVQGQNQFQDPNLVPNTEFSQEIVSGNQNQLNNSKQSFKKQTNNQQK